VRSSLLAASSLLTALAWTIALVVDSGPFQSAPTLLIGIGMMAAATVATVGMVVVGGRWAHRLGFAALGMTVIIAVIRPIDFWWVLGVITTAGAVLMLLSPSVTSMIRKLPSAAGPPPRAVAPALVLLVAPALLGFAGNDAAPWALLMVGLTAPLAAFLYSRVMPGGLLGVRVVWPAVALVLTPLLGWVAGSTASTLAAAVAVAAWHPSIKASYHPPREVGSTFPIPPGLAPKEVLDAARIDEKGRRT
jgi:MFS family permease